jgi:hypothetical protein
MNFLEAIAEHASEQFLWRKPFALESATCDGIANAAWKIEERKIVVCYEIAAEFAELYMRYGIKQNAHRKQSHVARSTTPKQSRRSRKAGL